MRFFEILILILLVTNVFRLLVFRKQSLLAAGLAWSSAAATLIHWILEGPRWQMYPAYALTLLSAISYHTLGKKMHLVNLHAAVRWFTVAVLVILMVVSIALPVILPVPEIGSPGGPFPVGTWTLHLIDADRNDPYAPDPTRPRELMVQIWYPAQETGKTPVAPWMDSAAVVAPRIAEWLGLPSFFLNHLRYADSGASLHAEPNLQEAPYPLLLFSHGYGGFRAQNTNQALELASHGFVVVGVEHTYAAVVTVFPDGRVATHNPDTLPDGLSEQESLEATRALGQQWAHDLQFVLDSLAEPEASETMIEAAAALDPRSVGVYGHSTGGGASIEFCSIDSRCDSVLTMDPYLKPVSQETLREGLAVPALHVFSESWPNEENTGRFTTLIEASNGAITSVSIAGTGHYDFSDLPLLTPLAHTIGLKGPLPGPRVIEIVNTLSVQFFDQTLVVPNGSELELKLESYSEISPFP